MAIRKMARKHPLIFQSFEIPGDADGTLIIFQMYLYLYLKYFSKYLYLYLNTLKNKVFVFVFVFEFLKSICICN